MMLANLDQITTVTNRFLEASKGSEHEVTALQLSRLADGMLSAVEHALESPASGDSCE